MNNRNTILEELKELNSSLGSLVSPTTPFQVPEGYFEGLAGRIMDRIKRGSDAGDELPGLSPLLASLPRKMPYSVPEDYFNLDPLPVVTEEKDTALLSLIERQTPYQVPYGYFDEFPGNMVRRLNRQEGRVVRMGAPRRWMRLAVAVVSAGIIILSGVFYFNSKNNMAVDNPQWVSKQLKGVSDRELDEFVRTVSPAQGTTDPAASEAGEDVETLLSDVPDSELQAFLDQMPEEELAFN